MKQKRLTLQERAEIMSRQILALQVQTVRVEDALRANDAPELLVQWAALTRQFKALGESVKLFKP